MMVNGNLRPCKTLRLVVQTVCWELRQWAQRAAKFSAVKRKNPLVASYSVSNETLSVYGLEKDLMFLFFFP